VSTPNGEDGTAISCKSLCLLLLFISDRTLFLRAADNIPAVLELLSHASGVVDPLLFPQGPDQARNGFEGHEFPD
jgi:hypothetical protein